VEKFQNKGNEKYIHFVLKAIHLLATTEYINFSHWFCIFCTKGDSLLISAILLETITLQAGCPNFPRPTVRAPRRPCARVAPPVRAPHVVSSPWGHAIGPRPCYAVLPPPLSSHPDTTSPALPSSWPTGVVYPCRPPALPSSVPAAAAGHRVPRSPLDGTSLIYNSHHQACIHHELTYLVCWDLYIGFHVYFTLFWSNARCVYDVSWWNVNNDVRYSISAYCLS
jgi:hypothetical protein